MAALGAVYFAQGKTESAAEHVPDYLRKSQAERELDAARADKEKMQALASGHVPEEISLNVSAKKEINS